MCAVPAQFTASEVRKAHRFVLAAASRGRVVGGKVVGKASRPSAKRSRP